MYASMRTTSLILLGAVVAAAALGVVCLAAAQAINQVPQAASSIQAPAPVTTNVNNANTAPRPQEKAVWPMVDVDRTDNKSTVDVHVPIFFDMTNHNDPQGGKSRLDLSVLQGLVTVSKDKQRTENGTLQGPVKVTVFGIPVYSGKTVNQQPSDGSQRNLENSVGQVRSALTDRANTLQNDVVAKVQQTQDKIVGSLADIFGRITTFIRQTPIFSGQQEQLQP